MQKLIYMNTFFFMYIVELLLCVAYIGSDVMHFKSIYTFYSRKLMLRFDIRNVFL